MRIISFNANGLRSAANKGFFDWFRTQDADVLCVQETKAQEHQLADAAVPARRLPRLVQGREHQEGLQRRRDLQPARARRSAHGDGLGAVRRRRPLHRGALRQPQRGVVLHPVRLLGRGAPGLQVRGDGLAQAAPGRMARQRPRLRAVRRLEHRALARWTSRTGPATRRTPAACRPSATGSTACAPTTAAGSTPIARCTPTARTTPGGATAVPRAPTTSVGASTTSSSRRRCATG